MLGSFQFFSVETKHVCLTVSVLEETGHRAALFSQEEGSEVCSGCSAWWGSVL